MGDDGPSLITPKNVSMVIGASLAIGGNLLISIAMNVQKYALTHLENGSDRVQEVGEGQEASPEAISEEAGEKKLLVVKESDPVISQTYLRSKLWWAGITLMIIGEIGNFMAYGFGPASVVAPLGTTTVVANAYIAIIFLGEKLRWQDVIGTYIILVGAFLIITFSTQHDTRLTALDIKVHLLAWPFVIYFVVEGISFCGILYYQKHHKKASKDHVVLHILPAALIASLTIISVKAVAGMISLSWDGYMQLQYPMFYLMLFVIVGTGVIQVRFVTSAMQQFDSTVVVPTYFVFFTISAILAGVFFYGEFAGLSFIQMIMFVFGCFCSFLGVYLITHGRTPTEDKESEFNLPINSELSSMCPFPYTVQMVQPSADAEDRPGTSKEADMTEDTESGVTVEQGAHAEQTNEESPYHSDLK